MVNAPVSTTPSPCYASPVNRSTNMIESTVHVDVSGPQGSGKSLVLRALVRVLSQLGATVKVSGAGEGHSATVTLDPERLSRALDAVDPRASELVLFTAFFEDDYLGQTHVVLRSDVPRMLQAFVALHHDPGVNPYAMKDSGGQTSRLREVHVRPLTPPQSYGWTTPDLGVSGIDPGVPVYDSLKTDVVWRSPSQLEEDLRSEREED